MKVFIFDLDGTLLNTLGDLANAANHILEENGFPTHHQEKYRQMVGNGFEMLIRRAIAPAEVSDQKIAELVQSAKNWYANHLTDETMPYPGMTVTLNMLLNAGAILGIFSNKPDAFVKKLANYFFPGVSFTFALGAQENLPLKPNPLVLLNAIKPLGFDKDAICYIGDSNVDILTAQNAGIFSVGAAWGFRGAQELKDAGANIIINEPVDLLPLINFIPGE